MISIKKYKKSTKSSQVYSNEKAEFIVAKYVMIGIILTAIIGTIIATVIITDSQNNMNSISEEDSVTVELDEFEENVENTGKEITIELEESIGLKQ